MNQSGDLCMWYKGNGVISLVDVKNFEEIRTIEGVAGKKFIFKDEKLIFLEQNVIRKLVAWDDFSKIVTLNLHDKATRDEIYLTICDLNYNKLLFSQEYTSFTRKILF